MVVLRTLLLASSVLAAPTLALAQQIPTPEAVGLEEIIVTAQRRAENLQTVPIAVSAITAAAAAQLGTVNPQSIAQLVPSMQLPSSGAALTPFLRGIGSNSSVVGNEPSVAIVVDDIYVPTGGAAVFNFNSISSVEILKGPQGTLFGRNATGGVIHVHTRDPQHEPTANGSLTYASYGTYQGQVYASGAISEAVAVNLAAYAQRRDEGWGENILNGAKAFNSRGFGLRGKLLADLGENTTLRLIAGYDRVRGSDGMANRVVPGTFTRSGYSPDRAGAGFYDITTDVQPVYENSFRQYSGKLQHDLGAARLVAITAFSELRSPSLIDIDASPEAFFNAYVSQRSRTFTQELQLLSPDDAAMQWILGGFYLRDRVDYRARFVGTAFGPSTLRNNAIQRTRSLSGFAQATGEILPRTHLTLGLRYTSDRRSLDANSSLTPPVGAVISTGPLFAHKTFQNLTGRASLDHRLSDTAMIYVAYNRGFKSGVYNIAGGVLNLPAIPAPVLPEDLNAYSAGFKSELFDRRLRLNGEAFYYDYSNVQVQNIVAGGAVLTNGGAATIKGLELDATAVVTSRLQVTLAVSVQKGRYDRFVNGPKFFPLPPNTPAGIPGGCVGVPPYPPAAGAAPIAQRPCDLSGAHTIQTPPFSSSLSAHYEIPLSFGLLELAAAWSHVEPYYFEPDNNPATRQPRTDRINASVKLGSEDGRFALRGWVRNLTGEKDYTYIAQSTAAGTKYAPGEPRTWGLTLEFAY